MGQKMTRFPLRIAFCLVLTMTMLAVTCVRADFANDGYTDTPDILLRIVTAATSESAFKPHLEDGVALYLRSAKYVGPLEAPFGTIHVAYLFYVRSAPKDSKAPARSHSYVVFLDRDFKIRAYWPADLPNEDISVRNNKLWEGNDLILDYSHLPSQDSVIFDGQPRAIPKWSKQ